MRITIAGILSVLFLAAGCEIIEGPTRQTSGNVSPLPNDTVVKKVLLEDYTGHTCGNCPAAARLLYNTIKPLYGNRLITLGIHAGYFAEPCPPHTYPSNASWPAYSTDFNTPAGTKWFNDFNIQFSPNGMVNRVKSNGNYAVPVAQWAARVDALMQIPPELGIKISTGFDSTSRVVTATCIIRTVKEMTGNYNLVVGISEDNVKDWQLDYEINPSIPPNYQNNPDYLHRHVFRGAINGSEGFGEQVIAGSAPVDFTVTRSYSYTLSASWNENNCSVVAFVYNTTTKEITQVEEKRVK